MHQFYVKETIKDMMFQLCTYHIRMEWNMGFWPKGRIILEFDFISNADVGFSLKRYSNKRLFQFQLFLRNAKDGEGMVGCIGSWH